jgi:hypothetical protein
VQRIEPDRRRAGACRDRDDVAQITEIADAVIAPRAYRIKLDREAPEPPPVTLKRARNCRRRLHCGGLRIARRERRDHLPQHLVRHHAPIAENIMESGLDPPSPRQCLKIAVHPPAPDYRKITPF